MQNQAVRYILLATLLFTILNVFVKYLPHIPTSQLVFFRGLLSLMISLGFAYFKKLPVLGKNKPILMLRGLFGTISLFALFYCLQNMPIAMASVLSNLAPLFTVLIAHFFLKEKASWVNAVLLILAFIGVFFIKDWDESVSWSLALVGVGGAFFAACAYTCVRVLRTTEHPMIVILYFPLISIPTMAYPMSVSWVPPTASDWLLIIGIGVLTQFAQYYMTVSYQLEKASKIMIYNYVGVIWSIGFGMFLFNEFLTLQQVLGVSIVLIAIVLTAWSARKKRPNI